MFLEKNTGVLGSCQALTKPQGLDRQGRRNLNQAWRIELQLANKADLEKVGRERKIEAGKEARDKQLGVLSHNDKTPEPKHNTQAEIARAAGTSTGMVGMAEVVRKAGPELWERRSARRQRAGRAMRNCYHRLIRPQNPSTTHGHR